jgi:hypothetical protein
MFIMNSSTDLFAWMMAEEMPSKMTAQLVAAFCGAARVRPTDHVAVCLVALDGPRYQHKNQL